MSVFSHFSRNLIGSSFVFLSSLFVATQSHSTTVQFQTVMGNIEVNLFDKTTPETVKNFLDCIDDGAYQNTVIHRSDKSLNVLQGGGLTYPNALPLTSIKRKTSVLNEPVYSNVRGTLAMAKQSGKPNSATSEWYFNLKDNSSILDPNDIYDTQSYTVFGQVTEASLPVLDAMATVDTFIIGSYTNFPLRNYTVDDYKNNVAADDTNLVLITNIVVLNASPDTADGLNPAKNTLLKLDSTDDSGGGSLGLIELLLLFALMYSVKNRFYSNSRRTIIK
jgi:peptidyl-prolyl cis-trans isomerase A (cyclophilin A)